MKDVQARKRANETEKQVAPSRSLSEAHGRVFWVLQQITKKGGREWCRRKGWTGCPEENKRDGRYNIDTNGTVNGELLLLLWLLLLCSGGAG
jgi:hypothetical protein